MEALGRALAVILGVIVLFFSFLFCRVVSVQWQKNETIRSIGNAFVEDVIRDATITQHRLDMLQRELDLFGTFQVEVVVHERRRFEGEEGRIYLFQKWMMDSIEMKKEIADGSYVRLKVTEKRRSRWSTFFYGESATYIAGGRV